MSKIDSKAFEEIRQIIDEMKKNGNEQGILEIILENTSGDIEDAMPIIQAIHGCENIDLHTHAKGKIDRAGTLIAAAGQPGFRSTDRNATFELLTGSTYPSNVDMSTLREEDELFVEVLQKLTGKRKAVLEAIKKSKSLNSASALRLGIIDSRPEFKSKYAVKRTRTAPNS